MPNRLIDSTSPYLLQHARNPVDWYPWGAEALERARREDKPIFLSIGYAACHWCHVMEHESFEHSSTAALMNRLFVNIKVDREERPDLDDLYMLATQLMTGQGGWPMSVWLTPALEPFYAGTYFPPVDGFGRPGFPRLLEALAAAWRDRRADLESQSKRVVEAIRMHADESAAQESGSSPPQPASPSRDAWIRLAIEQFSDRFDAVNGGLGSAPKFPPHQALQLWAALLDGTHENVAGLSGADEQVIAGQLVRTLDGMKNGGIYDQIGGGFARYSTDERWLVPHFEKMLYDSAQLAPVYARASRILETPEYARIARHTLAFFLREMRAPSGGFYSSLDADSDGAEGKYYVWTLEDLQQALPDAQDAQMMQAHLGLTAEGNWHESPIPGGSVATMAAGAESLSQRYEIPLPQMRGRLDHLLEILRRFRAQRKSPGLDDKILTCWNGLMLSALAQTGQLLAAPEFLTAAAELADFLLANHMLNGRLLRVSRAGAPAHTPGFLDDHAFLLQGLIDAMVALPGRADQWRPTAVLLADAILRDFQDHAPGGFFFTSEHHEKLFCRMKNAADNATPSANGVAIRALLGLSVLTGDTALAQVADRAVSAFGSAIARRPEYFPTILLGLLEAGHGPEHAASQPKDESKTTLKKDQGLSLHVSNLGPLHAGDSFDLHVQLAIATGFHIHSEHGVPHPTAMRLRARAASVMTGCQWEFPPAHAVADGPGYEGTISFVAHCQLAQDASPGHHVLRLSCTAQRCSQTSCLPPETISLDIQIQLMP